MKILLIVAFALILGSCKEDCNDCVVYVISNQIEAEKKCEGQQFDLSDFTETNTASYAGTACSSSDRSAIEGIIEQESVFICDGVSYSLTREVRCNQ